MHGFACMLIIIIIGDDLILVWLHATGTELKV